MSSCVRGFVEIEHRLYAAPSDHWRAKMTLDELTAKVQRLEANQGAYELVLSLLLHEAGSPTRSAVRHLGRETLRGAYPVELKGAQRDQMGTTLLQLLQTGLPPDTPPSDPTRL
jgi:hypothetical protein